MTGVLLHPGTGKPIPDNDVRYQALSDVREREQFIRDRVARGLPVSRGGQAFEERASAQSWRELLYCPISDGVTVAAAAEAIMFPDFNLPANYFSVGRAFKYRIWFELTSPVTTPGTFTFRLRTGVASTGLTGTALCASAAQRPKITVSTSFSGFVEFMVVVRNQGTAGSLYAMGQVQIGQSIGDAQAASEEMIPQAVPVAVAVDTTVVRTLTPTVQPSLATGSFTAHMGFLEALN